MKLKQWLALSVTAILMSACGGESTQKNEAPAQEVSEKVYRVATNAEFAPFEYLGDNSEIKGFDIDLLNAMAQAGHFKVQYKHQPWDGIFATLATGDTDIVISAVTITPERQQTMDFSDSYFDIHQVVLTTDENLVKSVEDLKNLKKVGVVNGQTGDVVVSNVMGATSNKVARYESLPLAVEALLADGVQAAVSDSAAIEAYVNNNPDKQFFIVEIPDFPKEDYGIVVRKNEPELKALLNDSLRKIRESGEYQKIYDSYFKK